MTKFLPVGIQDFEKMISGDFVYVDKTRFMYEMARPLQVLGAEETRHHILQASSCLVLSCMHDVIDRKVYSSNFRLMPGMSFDNPLIERSCHAYFLEQ